MNIFSFPVLVSMTIIITISSIIDYKYKRIPNYVTYPSILFGISYHFYTSGLDGLLFSLFGIIAGIGLLIIPYFLDKIGAGDAKLLGAIGSFIGAKSVFISFLYTAVAGGLYALLIMFLYKNKYNGYFKNFYYSGVNFVVTGKFYSFEDREDISQRPKLCYGLAIAAGTGIFIIFEVAGIKVLPL